MPYPDTFEGFSVYSHEKWSDFKRTEVRSALIPTCEQERRADLALSSTSQHFACVHPYRYSQLIPKTFGDNDVDILVECCGVCGSAYLLSTAVPQAFCVPHPHLPRHLHTRHLPQLANQPSLIPHLYRRSPHPHRRLGPKKAPSLRRPRNRRQSHQNRPESYPLQNRRPRRSGSPDQGVSGMQGMQIGQRELLSSEQEV